MTIPYNLQKGVMSNDQRVRDFERVANTIELLPDWVCKLVEQCMDRMVLQFFGDTTITIIAPVGLLMQIFNFKYLFPLFCFISSEKLSP